MDLGKESSCTDEALSEDTPIGVEAGGSCEDTGEDEEDEGNSSLSDISHISAEIVEDKPENVC